MRDISEILLFRGDVSPFLAHLTRILGPLDARARLQRILDERRLIAGTSLVSDARFGGNTLEMSDGERQRLFSAICLTETPLSEVHCLLEIAARAVDLEPYGLLFIKDRLRARGVSPVIYLNNEDGGIDEAVQALFTLKAVPAASLILPLVAVFGQKVWPPGAHARPAGRVDFLWEREWRRPPILGPLAFTHEDIFCGLCPHEEIAVFEAAYPSLKFIDPRRNMKWYATELIHARQRLDLKNSVV
jgi:hypothetical protein